jgi:hypothetical protein
MVDLRPLDFGETLDGSLVIYRRQFGLFLQLAAVTLAVPFLLLVYVGARYFGSLLLLVRLPSLGEGIAILAVAAAFYLASLVLTAGTIRVISDSYLGRTPQLRDALALGVAKLGSLVWVGLAKGAILTLIGLGIAVSVALLVALARSGAVAVFSILAGSIGGAWALGFVLCGYAVTTPVVVLEQLSSPNAAFRRSWELTKHHKAKVLGLWAVAFLLTNTVPSIAFRALGILMQRPWPPVGFTLTAVGYVLPLVLAPIVAAVITLMYYDLRVRREAFDLDMLAQQLGPM